MRRQFAELGPKVGEDAPLSADHLAQLVAVATTADPTEACEVLPRRCE
jgi:hypothetical protein